MGNFVEELYYGNIHSRVTEIVNNDLIFRE